MKITKDTVVRTVILVITIINLGLTALGWSPISIEMTSGLTSLAAIIVYWYNNSWSAAAIKSDVIKNILKDVEEYDKSLEEGE